MRKPSKWLRCKSKALAASRSEQETATLECPLFLGGHSYGGRQASILAADEPTLVQGLLLLSYPLHPPAKPGQRRTVHFPRISVPAMFVHGTADPFGSVEELQVAVPLIPAPTKIIPIVGARHDLKSGRFDLPGIVTAFLDLVAS